MQPNPLDLPPTMSSAAPPGFRFYPTEDELIGFFLRHKLDCRRESDIERVIPVADVYSIDPWRLPWEACRTDGEQWFFFCPRQARGAYGGRPTRTTPSGYWKATGSPSFVFSSADDNPVVGVKRTMAFYQGRAPTGAKTKWRLNDYRALADHPSGGDASLTSLIFRSEFSVCRVYTKSGCVRAFDRRPVGGARRVTPALASAFDGDSLALRRGAGGETNSVDDDSYMADLWNVLEC